MNRRVATTIRPLKSLLFPAFLLLLWYEVTAREIFPPMLLVSPQRVAQTIKELAQSGVLWENLSISLERVAKGFGFGTSLGLIVGICFGVSRLAEELFAPTLRAVRQVPLLGWMPLIILWFGIGELSKVILIALGAFFPTMLNTMIGIRNVSPEYLEIARVYRVGWPRVLRLILLPAALPSIVSGIRISIGLSWMLVVAAELIAADSGLGQMMSNAREMFQTDVVMAGVVVIGIVGLVIDTSIQIVENRLSRWRAVSK